MYTLRIDCGHYSFEQRFPTSREALVKLYELKLEHNVKQYSITKETI